MSLLVLTSYDINDSTLLGYAVLQPQAVLFGINYKVTYLANVTYHMTK